MCPGHTARRQGRQEWPGHGDTRTGRVGTQTRALRKPHSLRAPPHGPPPWAEGAGLTGQLAGWAGRAACRPAQRGLTPDSEVTLAMRCRRQVGSDWWPEQRDECGHRFMFDAEVGNSRGNGGAWPYQLFACSTASVEGPQTRVPGPFAERVCRQVHWKPPGPGSVQAIGGTRGLLGLCSPFLCLHPLGQVGTLFLTSWGGGEGGGARARPGEGGRLPCAGLRAHWGSRRGCFLRADPVGGHVDDGSHNPGRYWWRCLAGAST